MQRYFLNEINNFITGSDYHHIKNVMRMNAGDFIIVCSENVCYKAQITSIKDKVEYQIIDELSASKNANITIIQGLPKNNKIDIFLKYATCFGASKIILVEMTRSIAKIANIEGKMLRFQTIVKEASELSHRNSIPEVLLIKNIKQIDFSEFDITLVADELEKQYSLREIDLSGNKSIAVVIGPEGGIDNKEREILKEKSQFITLGANILPTEVANLYVLSAIKSKIE